MFLSIHIHERAYSARNVQKHLAESYKLSERTFACFLQHLRKQYSPIIQSFERKIRIFLETKFSDHMKTIYENKVLKHFTSSIKHFLNCSFNSLHMPKNFPIECLKQKNNVGILMSVPVLNKIINEYGQAQF